MTCCVATEYSDIFVVPKQPFLKIAKEQLAAWIERYYYYYVIVLDSFLLTRQKLLGYCGRNTQPSDSKIVFNSNI